MGSPGPSSTSKPRALAGLDRPCLSFSALRSAPANAAPCRVELNGCSDGSLEWLLDALEVVEVVAEPFGPRFGPPVVSGLVSPSTTVRVLAEAVENPAPENAPLENGPLEKGPLGNVPLPLRVALPLLLGEVLTSVEYERWRLLGLDGAPPSPPQLPPP